jgi:hypothetical protein
LQAIFPILPEFADRYPCNKDLSGRGFTNKIRIRHIDWLHLLQKPKVEAKRLWWGWRDRNFKSFKETIEKQGVNIPVGYLPENIIQWADFNMPRGYKVIDLLDLDVFSLPEYLKTVPLFHPEAVIHKKTWIDTHSFDDFILELNNHPISEYLIALDCSNL